MNILHISAQKPSGTGSGTVFCALVRAFAAQGHAQAAVAGVAPEDRVMLPGSVPFYPVGYETEALPFPVAGMSDEMPYRSTRYRDMTPEMTAQFRSAFLAVIRRAVDELDPDLILCHHLYLLTAAVRQAFPDRRVYGICHNTDLRQMEKHGLEREAICRGIRSLDRVLVLKEEQVDRIVAVYGVPRDRIRLMGVGYDRAVFRPLGGRGADGLTRIVFAGKIAEKKGVLSLLRSLCLLRTPPEKLRLLLAGGAGDGAEYAQARALAAASPVPVQFLGPLPQGELAAVYSAGDVFVLPSFSEGVPLTLLEALACGTRAVVSDLPGLRTWMDTFVPGAPVRYVPLPEMDRVDEPLPGTLPAFEARLAAALDDAVAEGPARPADMSRVSWESVAERILS